jgi:solute carrier family 35 (UDP-galactose transporter), member B1
MCEQVLAKSCKMIPVMVMGTLIGGKFYSTLEYLCAGLIAIGISLFAGQSSSHVTKKLANPNAPLGYFLCLANLVLDGYTNASQVRLLPIGGPWRRVHVF